MSLSNQLFHSIVFALKQGNTINVIIVWSNAFKKFEGNPVYFGRSISKESFANDPKQSSEFP